MAITLTSIHPPRVTPPTERDAPTPDATFAALFALFADPSPVALAGAASATGGAGEEADTKLPTTAATAAISPAGEESTPATAGGATAATGAAASVAEPVCGAQSSPAPPPGEAAAPIHRLVWEAAAPPLAVALTANDASQERPPATTPAAPDSAATLGDRTTAGGDTGDLPVYPTAPQPLLAPRLGRWATDPATPAPGEGGVRMAAQDANRSADPTPPATAARQATAAPNVAAITVALNHDELPTLPTARGRRAVEATPSAAMGTGSSTLGPLDPVAAPPSTASPVVPSRVAAEVAEQVRQSGPGRHRLEITLHPPELGRVEVHLVVSSHSVHAHLVAENEAGRDGLAHHLAALRDQLAAQGFTDTQVGVEVANHGPHPRPRFQPPPHPDHAPAADEASVAPTPHPHAARPRLLDRLA